MARRIEAGWSFSLSNQLFKVFHDNPITRENKGHLTSFFQRSSSLDGDCFRESSKCTLNCFLKLVFPQE